MTERLEGVLHVVTEPVTRAFANGSVVLIRPEVPDWIRTTEAGAWIFEQLRAEPRSAPAVVAAVARHYRLPPDLVRASTFRLLRALVEQGYVAVGSTTEGVGPVAPPRIESLGLRQLWLHVTSRCDLRCRHCYYPVEHPGRDLPLELARRLFAEAAESGVRQVILSGGEPMLHPAIVELVEACRRAPRRDSRQDARDVPEWRIKLLSNGAMPDPDRFDRVVDLLDDLQISIDGVDAPTHDEIRGAGSFARAARAFQRLHERAAGVVRGISFTPTPGNLDRIGELPKLAHRLGADYIHLNQARPPADPARGEALLAGGFLADDFARRAIAAFRRLSVEVIAERREASGMQARALLVDASYGRTLPLIQTLHQDNCGAGLTTVALDPEGLAYPCAALVGRSECALGRFPESNLEAIRRAGAAWNRRVFSVERDAVCSACVYRHFCGGGCRAMAPTPGERDPSCEVLRGCFEEFFEYVSHPGQDELSRLAAKGEEGRGRRVRTDGCAEA